MGYTHYWRKSKSPGAELAAYAREIVRAAPCALDVVEIAADRIRIDGLPDETCETFMFESDAFAFCKTRQRPYDVVVTAILAVASHLDRAEVSSDGAPHEWEPGVALARDATGLPIENPIVAEPADWT